MKKASSSRTSRTDWKRVKSMKDRDIKLTPEHPELDIKHVARVIVRKGLNDDEAVLRAIAADDARTRAYARKRRRK